MYITEREIVAQHETLSETCDLFTGKARDAGANPDAPSGLNSYITL